MSKPIFWVFAIVCITILTPTISKSETISLYQSVDEALKFSPQLQALTHDHQAAEFDLKQSRGRYLPSVDLLLGYGLEQYSDNATRRAGAEPSDSDWDSRGDATLRLTQKVYDGGETSQQVAIQQALLDSANFQIQSGAQTVALDAIIAHLDVFRQRELVVLAEKNLTVHQDIYQSLAEREQAGAGSIADVTQAQARMARAQSTLYLSKADLSKALANYSRVVGFSPEPESVTYAGVPETLPPTLEKTLQLVENNNPELLALTTTLAENDARVALARSTYKPKIDIQLSSRYNDQLEGNPSWQNTNDAMLNLRWNLFNGGQDRAGASAALSRKNRSLSVRNDKLLELQESTSATWATYKSLHGQKIAYRDAVDFSQKTFDAYLNQFSVSQRSLLDVLIAENDYFQSASQLITVAVNETLVAYRILALTGDLQVSCCAGVRESSAELTLLEQALVLPSTGTAVSSAPQRMMLPEQEIQALIDRWATAWRAQDAAAYLACYSKQFTPEKGRSYQEWQKQRTRLLTTPLFIDLSLSGMQVHKQSDSVYRVDFLQNYRSDRYSDQISKNLMLEFQEGSWKIVSEQPAPYDSVVSPATLSQEQNLDILQNSPVPLSKDLIQSESVPSYALVIGPCINKTDVKRVGEILNSLKLPFSQNSGTGKVKMVRLFEGVYPAGEARIKLAKMKKTANSAYVLPEKDNKLGLYLGSFHDPSRANHFADALRQKNISVTTVAT
ncbi:MAG: TolC family outer membrane protein, partial [Desulfuromusa sp.]|nr:TolC family outer membrane protein [Desulfuromusa sp.]